MTVRVEQLSNTFSVIGNHCSKRFKPSDKLWRFAFLYAINIMYNYMYARADQLSVYKNYDRGIPCRIHSLDTTSTSCQQKIQTGGMVKWRN